MRDLCTLADLAELVGGTTRGNASVPISDVTHDSRDVGTGSLFVAIRGFTIDGHQFVPDLAGTAGAAAVEEWIEADIPQILVDDTRAALGQLADAVYGHPSGDMAVVGVTGTNGKTTVTYLVESIVHAAGGKPARIGTTGASINGRSMPSPRTTPEASDLHRLLAEMVAAGVTVAAIEVSSHALSLGRVDGVDFEVAAFTNLSQDHLDFHIDMEDYFRAKAKLFNGRASTEVIWVDDTYGRRLFDQRCGHAISVGFDDADVRASNVSTGLERSTFLLETPRGRIPVELPLGGGFNIANALVAAACSLQVEIDLDAIADGLRSISPVPGRMEPVDRGQPFSVLVDYAHSPGGVQIVVDAVRRITDGRVIVVVGAGGDRDREKRPLMGAAAARADVLIVTSDNPRSEDPDLIIDAVLSGTSDSQARIVREADRKTAIVLAVAEAAAGDVVLVLGKGHEPGQDIDGVVHPFHDREVVAEALAGAGYGT
ncbi:MAG: UDP-N-acetylmuramoyl-L-alanyl-D-glutamate--2,6-diaminopimelate ligase [Acidimicrobiia bacterium]|nr:UDP-N-acetylmuramoyl-L-alanyl-D-glutamate--2,6-diaminopimelate ligase [Acidimicrobiia bacterium]